MIDTIKTPFEEHLKLQDAIDASLAKSKREALLEHARMGRSICEGRDGKVVWVPPVEVFAYYGLDENGKPLEVNQDEVQPVAAPAVAR